VLDGRRGHARARASRRSNCRPRRGCRSSTGRSSCWRSGRSRSTTRGARDARRRRRGHVARGAQGQRASLRRARGGVRPHPGALATARTSARSRATARSPRATSTAARCRTRTRCAACRRCTAPRATRWRGPARCSRERSTRHRQPAGVRPRRGRGGRDVGRQLPRPAAGPRAGPVAIACAELANISERRVEQLVNPALSSGLPPFLAPDTGLDSGYMIAQVTAAALVTENKVLLPPRERRLDPLVARAAKTTSPWAPPPRRSAPAWWPTCASARHRDARRRAGLDVRAPLKPGTRRRGGARAACGSGSPRWTADRALRARTSAPWPSSSRAAPAGARGGAVGALAWTEGWTPARHRRPRRRGLRRGHRRRHRGRRRAHHAPGAPRPRGCRRTLALGTNKGQSTFGSSVSARSSTSGARRPVDRTARAGGLPAAFVGALLGARLVLMVPRAALRPVVLVLLVGVAAALAFRRSSRSGRPRRREEPRACWRPALIAGVIGAYDGFFGPGTGTFAHHGASPGSATRWPARAPTPRSSTSPRTSPRRLFALKGVVRWEVSLPMAAAQFAGSALGARLTVKRGGAFVRRVVLAVVGALVRGRGRRGRG
jgi:uncharacterized membrane protein YfcA